MKHISILVFLACAPILSACVTTTGSPATTGQQAGSSKSTAIKVDSIRAEYAWISANRPGWKPVQQALLIDSEDEVYDLIMIKRGNQSEELYFDIASFFGKGLPF